MSHKNNINFGCEVTVVGRGEVTIARENIVTAPISYQPLSVDAICFQCGSLSVEYAVATYIATADDVEGSAPELKAICQKCIDEAGPGIMIRELSGKPGWLMPNGIDSIAVINGR